MKVNIETGELVIDEKYVIKPLMTVEEIKNSNLGEILDEKSKVQLEVDPDSNLFLRRTVDGEEVIVEFEILGGKLVIIHITVDPAGISECYHAGDESGFSSIVSKNSRFMSELLKGSNNNYRFNWGKAEFNNGNRTYNVEIRIQYFRCGVI